MVAIRKERPASLAVLPGDTEHLASATERLSLLARIQSLRDPEIHAAALGNLERELLHQREGLGDNADFSARLAALRLERELTWEEIRRRRARPLREVFVTDWRKNHPA